MNSLIRKVWKNSNEEYLIEDGHELTWTTKIKEDTINGNKE